MLEQIITNESLVEQNLKTMWYMHKEQTIPSDFEVLLVS